ncbi:uncharacterized protein LAJ45_08165 [Morchella importuna]|uniref:GPI2-domain-containing protein n=1 Tax=Morchella conica CCBAS932 TaxID=1392247 RepID=A0A3N4KM99_9PEZI|nr:uncharacterized protein LAJ45_08165 [Morchella importuna]KAH8147700.1 hypothetical protein LAJ45_08165 [Morchella importuna]RPB10442.1 GPI2-domain-containing protein [Morchella conica CCBAS932]
MPPPPPPPPQLHMPSPTTVHRPSPPPLLTTPPPQPWPPTQPSSQPARHPSPNPRRSTSRKRKPWRKLLWVKQDYPDNWVDPTFLSQLQRNINVHPYDFYSLVADSTVIVQHLSSVVIFVTSFIAISAERVSPVAVAVASSALTVAGWAIWDMGYEKREAATDMRQLAGLGAAPHSRTPSGNLVGGMTGGLHSRTPSGNGASGAAGSYFPPYPASTSGESGSPIKKAPPEVSPEVDKAHMKHAQRARRLTTAKSAALIYFTLLGLSPILRSLTTTISVDSIWAIATWLFLANCLGFDYGSGVEVKFPASLPTNAAITSSVVLASRLPDTTHVFSLILFSIQVFGLFPVFRRYLKHVSWNLHVLLTVVLVLGAAGGLGAVVGWGWSVVWVCGVIGGMGGCGWWLIGLQKYKNEIHGPWDPARPVIRRQWE